jgi:hypoxanthine phosphoribosyltransferase
MSQPHQFGTPCGRSAGRGRLTRRCVAVRAVYVACAGFTGWPGDGLALIVLTEETPVNATAERLAPLLSSATIDARLKDLAADIRRDLAGGDVVVVGVLKGAFMFVADLVRALGMPVEIDFIGLASYGRGQVSTGGVTVTAPLRAAVAGRDVLVVEDILDTGTSLAALLADLRARGPRSLRVCVLLDKRERRLVHVPVDYVGFVVPKGFVVGYGIDLAERYRWLPAIFEIETETAA